MAFVGPLTTFVIGAVAHRVLTVGVAALPTGIQGVVLVLNYCSVFLAIFNLIPGFPLDGGRGLHSIHP